MDYTQSKITGQDQVLAEKPIVYSEQQAAPTDWGFFRGRLAERYTEKQKSLESSRLADGSISVGDNIRSTLSCGGVCPQEDERFRIISLRVGTRRA